MECGGQLYNKYSQFKTYGEREILTEENISLKKLDFETHVKNTYGTTHLLLNLAASNKNIPNLNAS